MTALLNKSDVAEDSASLVGIRRGGLWRRYPWISILILAIVVLGAIFAPYLTPHDPFLPVLSDRLEAPSSTHLLGTDSLGRDVLARLFYGARTTVIVVGFTLLVGSGGGLILGLIAGYAGGLIDGIIGRLMDVFMAFPVLFFGLMFAVTIGPGLFSLVTSISLVAWAGVGRVVRAETIAVKDREYIESAIVSGASPARLILRHILPNVIPTFIVLLSLAMAGIILAEAALSFLGAGVPLPSASWGGMITEGQRFLGRAWWIALAPGVAITASVLAINLFGDWLRDYLDPELKQLD